VNDKNSYVNFSFIILRLGLYFHSTRDNLKYLNGSAEVGLSQAEQTESRAAQSSDKHTGENWHPPSALSHTVIVTFMHDVMLFEKQIDI
jgi:hypothetical protein